MSSLPVAEQERAIREFALAFHFRNNQGESWDQVAGRLGYGSVEAMHMQFVRWNLPDWIVGGAPDSRKQNDPDRHARTTSEEPIELPSAYDAAPLFYGALKKFDWAVGDLENRKEHLQNGRFVAQEDAGQGGWPEMGIEDATLTIPLGAQQTPHDPLPALIAVYALADKPLEPLLEKLNPDPKSVNREQIQALIEGGKGPKGHVRGLRTIAGLIARAIRGGTVRQGRTTGEISSRIQNGAWYSRQLSERELGTTIISERLREAGFTRDEISQIQQLNKLP